MKLALVTLILVILLILYESQGQMPWYGGQGQRCELKEHTIPIASVRGQGGQLKRLLSFLTANDSAPKAATLQFLPL